MSIKDSDLTTGNLPKQILLFSLPLMFSNILQVLFNMSDIAVVGQFAGAEALGAVGSTATLVFLFTGFLIGIGNGIQQLLNICIFLEQYGLVAILCDNLFDTLYGCSCKGLFCCY